MSAFRNCRCVVPLAFILVIQGCLPDDSDLGTTSPGSAPEKTSAAPTGARASFVPRRMPEGQPGLHNVIEASAGLLSGSEPEGDIGFESLAGLGVKTIIS